MLHSYSRDIMWFNGQFQKISIPNHGRLPSFNPPLPSEIPGCVTPPCPQNSIIVNPPYPSEFADFFWRYIFDLAMFMYQSNRSFNIPPGQPPGHLNFWKIFVRIPPSWGQKAVQMPHCRSIPGDQMPPRPGNVSVAFIKCSGSCVCKHGLIDRETTLLHAKDNVSGSWIPSNTEQGLCKPLLFSQSATNRVAFALNAWRLVFAMIYHPSWNQRDS